MNMSLRFFYKHTKLSLIVYVKKKKRNISLPSLHVQPATHIYPSSEVVDDHADNLVVVVLLHRFHAHFSPGHANRAAWETTADVPGPRIPAEKKNSTQCRSMPSSIGPPRRIQNRGYAFPPNSFLSFFPSLFSRSILLYIRFDKHDFSPRFKVLFFFLRLELVLRNSLRSYRFALTNEEQQLATRVWTNTLIRWLPGAQTRLL